MDFGIKTSTNTSPNNYDLFITERYSYLTWAMSRISGLRNDMNKRTFYKERKINNRCFDFLSKQNITLLSFFSLHEYLEKIEKSLYFVRWCCCSMIMVFYFRRHQSRWIINAPPARAATLKSKHAHHWYIPRLTFHVVWLCADNLI